MLTDRPGGPAFMAGSASGGGESGASPLPSTGGPRSLLEDGIEAERLGDLERAIAAFTSASKTSDRAVAAEAFTRLADARRSRAEWPEGLAAARHAREVARAAGLDGLVLHAMVAEANVLMCRGDFFEAKQLFDEVLALATDPRMRGLALQNVGSIMAQQGELGAAERCFAESYGHFQRAGYRRGEAIALTNYGRVTFDRGNLSLAEDLLRQAAGIAREVEHAELMALATLNLAEVRMRLGDMDQAEDLASEALGFFCGCGNRWREIECLRLVGAINEQRGDLSNAAECYDRGLRLAHDLGAAVESRSLTECLSRVRQKRKS